MKFFDWVQSEDLPHESGIKTYVRQLLQTRQPSRKTCPTNRGLRLFGNFTNNGEQFVGRLAPRIGD